VAHVGEVAEQKVKRNRELAGVSVITVHRMLKNSVPVSEYVLMTEPLFKAIDPELQKFGHAQQEELEGLGETQVHYLDLDEIAAAPLPELRPSWLRRLSAWARMTWRSIPYFLGTKKACDGFRNLDPIAAREPAALAAPPQA